jgi:hypothetical protein
MGIPPSSFSICKFGSLSGDDHAECAGIDRSGRDRSHQDDRRISGTCVDPSPHFSGSQWRRSVRAIPVLSIKSECFDRLVPLGERHLRLAVAEYTRYYHFERNHQGLANALIDGESEDVVGSIAVACRERLGGLLKFYYREVA